jgi:hypothetical protein
MPADVTPIPTIAPEALKLDVSHDSAGTLQTVRLTFSAGDTSVAAVLTPAQWTSLLVRPGRI